MDVDTLVELYDERPLENVLGVEVLRPERVIYICAEKYSALESVYRKVNAYFRHRGLHPEVLLFHADIYSTQSMLDLFGKILDCYPDAVFDITGGTDAVLFAAGLACAGKPVPVLTYSRTRNRFYSIRNAPFAENLSCGIRLSVEDAFLMAGGVLRTGRVDNQILRQYMDLFDPFFALFLRHRRNWTRIVTYMQRVSPTREDGSFSLEVCGNWSVRGEHGGQVQAPETALGEMAEIGLISSLRIVPDESVSFVFRDGQVRAWLRDVGSVLELFVYKACLDTGLFDDVYTSAVVEWDSEDAAARVSNELDVMCTRGVTPFFISCKTCMVRTEALNELSVLRDRFGGKMARAAIVTAEPAGAAACARAADLNIHVISLEDLQDPETLRGRLRDLAGAD